MHPDQRLRYEVHLQPRYPVQGADEDAYTVKCVVSSLSWLGHARIILKSDGEPAIKALVKRVIELAKVEVKSLDQISSETSAAHDSQSNGSTEVGVQLVRGLFRTLRLCLEERINKLIPATHALTAWLVEHAALLYTASVRGEDGHTAWGRARGRAFRQQLLGFGEAVLYKHPSKGPGHAPQGNMGALGGAKECSWATAELRTPSLWGRRMAVRSSVDQSLDGQCNKGGTLQLLLASGASPPTANLAQILLMEPSCQRRPSSQRSRLPQDQLL